MYGANSRPCHCMGMSQNRAHGTESVNIYLSGQDIHRVCLEDGNDVALSQKNLYSLELKKKRKYNVKKKLKSPKYQLQERKPRRGLNIVRVCHISKFC